MCTVQHTQTAEINERTNERKWFLWFSFSAWPLSILELFSNKFTLLKLNDTTFPHQGEKIDKINDTNHKFDYTMLLISETLIPVHCHKSDDTLVYKYYCDIYEHEPKSGHHHHIKRCNARECHVVCILSRFGVFINFRENDDKLQRKPTSSLRSRNKYQKFITWACRSIYRIEKCIFSNFIIDSRVANRKLQLEF